MTVSNETSPVSSEVGLVNLVALLYRRRTLLLGVAFGFGVLGFVLAKVTRTWSAEVTIRPQTNSAASLSRLSGLAAQFGFSLPGAPVGDPVKFYAELVQSREVLNQAVQLPFVVARKRNSPDSLRGNFLSLYDIEGVDSADQVLRGKDRLKALMSVTTDREAGFVRVKLVTKWGDLSTDLLRRILALTSEASISKQRRQAEAEREFVEARLKDAQTALAEAENHLEQFLTTNRQYRNSPLLELQYGRLQRRVDLRQQVYAGLAQAYEQARIDEVRDTPVLTVVDGIDGSLRAGKRASRDAILWALVGGGLALCLVIALDSWQRLAAQPSQLSGLVEEMRRGWPLSWVQRRKS